MMSDQAAKVTHRSKPQPSACRTGGAQLTLLEGKIPPNGCDGRRGPGAIFGWRQLGGAFSSDDEGRGANSHSAANRPRNADSGDDFESMGSGSMGSGENEQLEIRVQLIS